MPWEEARNSCGGSRVSSSSSRGPSCHRRRARHPGMKSADNKSAARIDFFTRKLVYLFLQGCLALAFLTAGAYSRLRRRRAPRPGAVRSIAAVWYWPPDFPSASRTRLGTWKPLFEREGIRYDDFHVGSMGELTREYEAGSWTRRYWFYTKILWRRWRQLLALAPYDVVWIDRW